MQYAAFDRCAVGAAVTHGGVKHALDRATNLESL